MKILITGFSPSCLPARARQPTTDKLGINLQHNLIHLLILLLSRSIGLATRHGANWLGLKLNYKTDLERFCDGAQRGAMKNVEKKKEKLLWWCTKSEKSFQNENGFFLSLKQSAIFQIVLDDDVSDGVKDELNVVRVGGAGEVRVDLLLIFPLVEILEFHSYVAWCFFIWVGTLNGTLKVSATGSSIERWSTHLGILGSRWSMAIAESCPRTDPSYSETEWLKSRRTTLNCRSSRRASSTQSFGSSPRLQLALNRSLIETTAN